MRQSIGIFNGLFCALLLSVPTFAQEVTEAGAVSGENGIRLTATHVHQLRVGVRIKANGPCTGIVAAVPVPMDWPEQRVQIINEEFSPEVRSVTYRTLNDGAKQMLVNIPRLASGDVAEAILTVSIERQVMEPPTASPEIYQIPTRISRDLRLFLGDSPFIESRNNKIRSLAREITKDKPTAWDQVRAIYDYVRANVTYRESELKGAVQTLEDAQGDCEGMTSLFVALCRAHRVPARMVWVTDHSYPEFYLVDDQDQGHWFPCQISGSEAFAQMPEVRPIIQKGDNYRIPETRERRRYVALQLKAAAVRGSSPQVTEIMEFVGQ